MKKRVYDDACAANHAVDILGQRWVLAIMRELVLGPKRFGDLRDDLRDISANVLTQKLEMMEASGIVRRETLPPPARAQVYGLTEWGYQAAPIFQAMARWGARSPAHDPGRPMSATSLILSLRSMIDPERAAGFRALLGFRLGRESFVVRFDDGEAGPKRLDPPPSVDAVLEGAPDAVAALVHRHVPLAELEAEGALTVGGDRTLVERLATLYPACERAPCPDSSIPD